MKNSTTRVSISVVCYNQENIIEHTILSCLNQEYDNFEVVVSDDGSTDRTPQVLNKLSVMYPEKLRLILNNINSGITKNCNICLSHCTGELIALCAGDDILYPNKIATQVKEFEKNRELVCCYHPSHIVQDGIVTSIIGNKKKDIVKNFYGYIKKTGACIPAPSLMIKKSAIPEYGYDERIPTASDWLFSIECMSKGQVIRVDKILSAYRLHETNIGKSFILYVDDFLLSGEIIKEKYRSRKVAKLINSGVKRILLGSIFRAVILADHKLLKKSMQEYKKYNALGCCILSLVIHKKITRFLFMKVKKIIKTFI